MRTDDVAQARWARLAVAAGLAVSLLATVAHAQTAQTYVASTGRDLNNCTSAAPCQTFQYALSRTSPGGQIYVLNSGDYGPLTITQSLSISSAGAAGILATSSSTGITINAGPGDVVDLTGLHLDGGGAGSVGIQFNSGAALHVRDSLVRGFTTGVNFQPNGPGALQMDGTSLSNNATGLALKSSSTTTGSLTTVQAVNNNVGIAVSGVSYGAVGAVTVRNSILANNSTAGVVSNGYSVVTVADSTVVYNGVGLQGQNAGAVLHVSGTTITGNTSGWVAQGGGQVISNVNNAIGGNTGGNSGPLTRPIPVLPGTVQPSNYLTDGNNNQFEDDNGQKITAS